MTTIIVIIIIIIRSKELKTQDNYFECIIERV